MDKEQALTLLRAGYGDELRRAAYQFTAPLFWADPATPRPLFNNGSVFFLDCGDGPFAVTADHVYAAYLARKEQAPGLVCQIGRLRFKPEDRIIDRDQRLDVATFRIGEVEVERTAKWLHRPSSWPPVPPEEGRGVFLAGFARTLRDEKEEAVTFGSVSLLLTATTIGNDTITCQFDRENFVDMGSGLPPQPMSLEGVSGAPLWTLVDRPVVGWRLAGVVIEYNTAFELLIVRRADCITANGRLLR